MRIITGLARGVRLETLEGDSVRPTTEKVKEAIFSSIQFDIEGATVLDLFAGSGQLGLEALSRGARKAVFIDSSPQAIEIIKRNVKKTKLEKSSVVYRSDYGSFLLGTKECFDIAFIDPPYSEGILDEALKSVVPRMSDAGIIVCEHPSDVSVSECVGSFKIFKQYNYGKLICVTVYKI